MTTSISQFVSHVKEAIVVPIERQHDEWGVAITWSTGDEEIRHVGSRPAAEAEAKRLLAGQSH